MSPTIDIGATNAANGSFDFEGQPRIEAGKTDIGADEYVAVPVVTAGAPTAVSTQGATLSGTVNPGHDTTGYSFHYGTTPAMTSSTTAQSLAPGFSAQAVTAQVGGLPAGTTIYWELVATNSGGTGTTPMQHFVTAGTSKPKLTGLTLSAKVFRAATHGTSVARVKHPVGTKISYRDSQASTTTFTVQRPMAGIRKGKSCVAPPRKHKPKHPKRCTRYVPVGNFKHVDTAGANSFRFTGRVKGHALRPGSYRLSAVTHDANGSSTPVLISFRIVAH